MGDIRVLKNTVREYAWGSKEAIQDLLGKPEWVGRPMAELWMGAHPGASSMVLEAGRWVSLAEMVRADPESVLGCEVSRSFSSNLPFLFKVLAAASPLSLQAHPDGAQAEKGYERENRMGIPLDAPGRNYKDPNPKPELICALTPFCGLMGFREMGEIRRLMEEVLSPGLLKESGLFGNRTSSGGLRGLFSSLMAMDLHRMRRLVGEAAKTARARAGESGLFYWISELGRACPGDRGVLAPLLLHLFELNPGEALYIPAGQLHTYFTGLGLELMGNSDNVVRGGLTPKHTDAEELLRIVDFTPRPVKKVLPVARGECERIYPAAPREFLLSVITPGPGRPFASGPRLGVEILICTEGVAEVTGERSAAPLRVGRGDVFLVPGSVAHYRMEGDATLYKASVRAWDVHW